MSVVQWNLLSKTTPVRDKEQRHTEQLFGSLTFMFSVKDVSVCIDPSTFNRFFGLGERRKKGRKKKHKTTTFFLEEAKVF